jgi:ubiquinone/menaquinone biosynthesis C-methylase UbiE
MEKKDYFSSQAKVYAQFRPSYPDELYQFILHHVKGTSRAWDCATGNGQVARSLAKHFTRVDATDISAQQLENAFHASNIFYDVCPAERSPFADHQFDLITVAQALHWFDRRRFYEEVKRTAVPGGLLAVWGYGLLSIEPAIDRHFLDFYHNTVGSFWDEARTLVENHYRDVAFPFREISCPDFYIRVEWTFDQFIGYLSSWSATQKYIQKYKTDPLPDFSSTLKTCWKEDAIRSVTFPIFMKLGRIAE